MDVRVESWKDVTKLPDGTYYRPPILGGAYDYAERWAYGYIVGIEPLLEWHLPVGLFGVWTDDDGIRYYDRVEHVDDYATALARGRENGQSSIWDLRNREVVWL